MEIKVYKFENKRIEKLQYMINIPEGLETKPALLVALHGAGERGEDPALIFHHGVAKLLSEGRKIPAVVIAPQCPEGWIWNQLTVELKELIDAVRDAVGADPDRISLTGLSMGGYGTWEMGMSYPGYFSALAPICGGGVSWRAELIGKTPVRAFHGDADTVVPPINSIEMADRLKAAGGNVSLTLFHGVGHNSWVNAYRETNVIDWLISQRK